MRVLVTNDDGPDSPFVAPLVRAAAALGTVTVVLPGLEQSWTAKSMTRFRELKLVPRRIGDHEGFTVDGSPADCVNIGCYHLCSKLPDMVLSGVNLGENTGTAYASSSGTVGACLEGNIAGVPGIAFSQQVSSEAFSVWARRETGEPCWAELEAAAKRQNAVLPAVLAMLQPLTVRPSTWSLNIPWELSRDWRIEECPLAHTRYGSCFRRSGDVFRHVGGPPVTSAETTRRTDGDVLRIGNVSLTEIDLGRLG